MRRSTTHGILTVLYDTARHPSPPAQQPHPTRTGTLTARGPQTPSHQTSALQATASLHRTHAMQARVYHDI